MDDVVVHPAKIAIPAKTTAALPARRKRATEFVSNGVIYFIAWLRASATARLKPS